MRALVIFAIFMVVVTMFTVQTAAEDRQPTVNIYNDEDADDDDVSPRVAKPYRFQWGCEPRGWKCKPKCQGIDDADSSPRRPGLFTGWVCGANEKCCPPGT